MAIIICSKIKKGSKSSGVDCTGWSLASSIYTVSWCMQCAWQGNSADTCQLLPPTQIEITSQPKCNNTNISLKQALAGLVNYTVNKVCSNLLPPRPTLIAYLETHEEHFTLSPGSTTCQPIKYPLKWLNCSERLWQSDYTASHYNIQMELQANSFPLVYFRSY